MEANFHQDVSHMKPEVFKIYQKIFERRHNFEEGDSGATKLVSAVLKEVLGTLLQEIASDPDNWIPIPPQPNDGVVTSATTYINTDGKI